MGSPATLQRLSLTFTSPSTLMGSPFATLVVGSGPIGTQSVGGFWNFTGANQTFSGASGTASWTLGGGVGREVGRTIIPEPASGGLLALGLAAETRAGRSRPRPSAAERRGVDRTSLAR